MKNLIAQFSGKRSGVSFTSFDNDILTINELINVRGGGEPYQPDMPIIIPPGEGRSSN
jgi:hypothetical protein